jgi:O-antigen ligase
LSGVELTATPGSIAVFLAILSLALPLPPTVFVALLAAAFGLSMLNTKDGPRSPDRIMVRALLIFVFFSLLSALLAEGRQRALLTSLSLIPAGFVWYLVTSRVPSRLLVLLPWILAITMGVLTFYLLLVAAKHPGLLPQEWLDIAGYKQFSVPNDLLFLVVISPFLLLLIFQPRPNAVRVGAVLILIGVAACLILYRGRAAFAILIVVVLIQLLRYWPRGILLSLGILALVFVGVEWATGFQMTDKLLALGTLTARVPLWFAAWEMFLDAPILGHGPGSFSLLYEEYVSTVGLASWVVFDPRHMPWAHNLYLELLAERGLLGMSSFLAIVVVALKNSQLMKISVSSMPLRNGAVDSMTILLGAGLVDLSLLRLWVLVALSVQLALTCNNLGSRSS